MRGILILSAVLVVLGTSMAQLAEKLTGETAQARTYDNARLMDANASMPPETADTGRSVTIARDRRGHFQTSGRVEGRGLDFMVDTGASVVALNERSAAQIGFYPRPADYTAVVNTANGSVKAARTRLGSVNVGGLVVHDVDALVLPDAALSENLLGLSFLSKLRRFEFSGGRLVMEQ